MSSGNGCQNGEPRLRDLSSHLAPYVTVDDLARYWLVSRKQIYRQIEDGKLPAIRLGPRSLRIRTSDATEFELRSILTIESENERRLRAVPQSHSQRQDRKLERSFRPGEELVPRTPQSTSAGDKSRKATKVAISKRP